MAKRKITGLEQLASVVDKTNLVLCRNCGVLVEGTDLWSHLIAFHTGKVAAEPSQPEGK